MTTLEKIRKNKDINTYIVMADKSMAALGFTEHAFA